MSKKKKDKRQKIALSKYTVKGRVSTVLAVISIALLIGAIVLAIRAKGQAGNEVGMMAAVSLLLALIGFITGICSFKEETKFLTYSWVGSIMNLAVCLAMFMMFLIYV